MKDLWKGIAIAGIWVGVGLSAIFADEAIILVAFFAMMATAACAVARDPQDKETENE